MQIRAYLESDEEAVVALWLACGLTRSWNDPHKDIARKLTVQRDLFLVGELEGRLVSSVMAGFEGHRGWVYYLAVSPQYRGRGYGAELMKLVEGMLIERGCPKINLLVRRENAEVIAFYHELGFQEDAVVNLGKRLIADE